MATREEKQAAQDQLQKAVENILAVYGSFDDGEVIAGWTLIISGVRFQTKDDETYDEGDSEMETLARHTYFYQDGQNPTLTRGMIERCRDVMMG